MNQFSQVPGGLAAAEGYLAISSTSIYLSVSFHVIRGQEKQKS
jgi:hypothetical protein